MSGRQVCDDERGVALITVLGLSMVLMLLVTAVLQFGVGSLRQARYDQDWHASLAAADAGLDELLARLGRDPDYWRRTDDCVGCTGPDLGNPALTGYVTIADGEGQFTYRVDASTVESDGSLTVTSTGRVNGRQREVVAQLRREGFLDYVWFTDLEVEDPVLHSNPEQGAIDCSRYAYDGRPGAPRCYSISWSNNDVLDGPFHSNDRIRVGGSSLWTASATTSDPDAVYRDSKANPNQLCRGRGVPTPACIADPIFTEGLTYHPPLELPPSNVALEAHAAGAGCLYRGATFLRFNTSGSVTVRSVGTDSPLSRCPVDGTMASLPPNGVIYVRSAGADETCLPGAPHPYDLSADVTPYDQCAGDAFVEGTVEGRVTVGSENDVVISNHLAYAGGHDATSDDLLGLVADNFVEVMHPVTSNGDDIAYLPGGQRFVDPQIDAAVLSVSHSFTVQNFSRGGGGLGALRLYGAMAQKFRGRVGQNSGQRGYLRDFHYDPRLANVSPPRFLSPVKSSWAIVQWSEQAPSEESS